MTRFQRGYLPPADAIAFPFTDLAPIETIGIIFPELQNRLYSTSEKS